MVLLHGKSKPICNHSLFLQTSKSSAKHLDLLPGFKSLFKPSLIARYFNCHDSTSRAVREPCSCYYLVCIIAPGRNQDHVFLAIMKNFTKIWPCSKSFIKICMTRGNRWATREQQQQKKFIELKAKQWTQYEVRSSVPSLLQCCISGLKPNIGACSLHRTKFRDYPAFLKFL